MHPILNIASRAARSAGEIIVRSIERLDTVKVTEKKQNDYVTEIDKLSEKIIIETIRKNYPNHAILGEESGTLEGNEEFLWIIDPLDGTRNFMHGFPHFCISIGFKYKDRLEHGLIYDPIRQEMFTASRGNGAQLNNRRIRVSSRTTLNGALLGTGFPFMPSANFTSYLKTLSHLMPKTGGIRRAGAAALDLAYVAAGRMDGFWEFGLSPWDIAAGSLLVLEAGGLVSDVRGSEEYLANGDIIAGNPKIFKALLQNVRSALLTD
jgi:myo-inositol-1(or 4)-monophosphatase